jgi:DNA repair exonuclease SbcCD ATPase subunit
MYIELKYIKFKNILSYGAKWTEFKFNKGVNLITGMNGQGKSTLLEALSYNWFGEPYRKINLSDLINRTNKKNLETESCIKIDNDEYIIYRSMKPNKLLLTKNGETADMLSTTGLNQEEIEKILGIDYKMFKQVVSLAVTYNVPFLTMKAQDKRAIVESIFNIKVFGKMLKNLKKRISAEKIKFDISSSAISIMEEGLKAARKNLSDAKKAKNDFDVNKQTDIKRISDAIDGYINEINDLIKNISKNDADIMSHQKNIDKLKSDQLKIQTLVDNFTKPDSSKLAEQMKIVETNYLDEVATILNNHNSNTSGLNAKKEGILKEIEIVSNQTTNEKYCDDIKKLENCIETNDKVIIKCHGDKSVLNNNVDQNNQQISFLKSNDICPKCKSVISQEYKLKLIDQLSSENNAYLAVISTIDATVTDATNSNNESKNKIKEILNYVEKSKSKINELKSDLNKIESEISYADSESKHLKAEVLNKRVLSESKIKSDFESSYIIEKQKLVNSVAEINSEIKDSVNKLNICNMIISSDKNKISSLNNDIEKLKLSKTEINDRVFTIDVDAMEKQFNNDIVKYQTEYNKHKDTIETLKVYDISSKMLSDDGIKSFFFEKLTPILNVKINEYISKFNVPIIISFNNMMEESIYDINNKNEPISYYSYSEGEKKSIDISILMSFISLMKVINNWNCNFLIIDEMIDGQVDSEKLFNMISCIRGFISDNSTQSIYVISHRTDDTTKTLFDETIKINKIDGFSEIETGN